MTYAIHIISELNKRAILNPKQIVGMDPTEYYLLLSQKFELVVTLLITIKEIVATNISQSK